MIASISEKYTSQLSENVVAQAQRAEGDIAGFLNGEEQIAVTFAQADGRRMETIIPTAALRFLAQALGEMAQGKIVTLIPSAAELTTHQAAKLLGVSRPYLIKRMEAGKIPFRRTGTHRRVRYDDLLAYREQDREERHRGLDELTALSEEMRLYDAENVAIRK